MIKINRKKLIDRTYNVRDAKLFVIATEGAETEKQYFKIFQSTKIKIEVLPTGEDNRSAPNHVLDRLDGFYKKYDLSDEDSLWLMFDVDRWKTKTLSDVCRQARQKNYDLAISNPCFECWLYLHFDDLDPNDTQCKIVEDKLRAKLGSYNKSNLDLAVYKDKIQAAVQRAKTLDQNLQHNWPLTPGTRVYKIVEILIQEIGNFDVGT